MVTTRLHNTATDSDLHTLIRWTVANATARLALVVVAGDIGKLAFQEDTQGYYLLADNSPMTWAFLGAGGSSGDLDSVLTIGNTTGGNNIVVSTGDSIVGQTALTLGTVADTGIVITASADTVTTYIGGAQAKNISLAAIPSVGSTTTWDGVSTSAGALAIRATSHATPGRLVLGTSSGNFSAGIAGLDLNSAAGIVTIMPGLVNNLLILNGTAGTGQWYVTNTIAHFITGVATLTIGSGYWTSGAVASAADAGRIRMPASSTIVSARDNAGTGNLSVISTTFAGGTDRIHFGIPDTTGVQTFGAAAVALYATAAHRIFGNGTTWDTVVGSVNQLTVGSGYWTLGATASAASAGSIRLPHGSTIQGLQSGGGGDKVIIAFGVAAANVIEIGTSAATARVYVDPTNSATYVQAGSTTLQIDSVGVYTAAALRLGASPATTGSIRLSASGTIYGIVDSVNNPIITTGASTITYGNASDTGMVITPSADTISYYYAGALNRIDSTSYISFNANVGSGNFRVGNATTVIAARNAAGSADLPLVRTTSADLLQIGAGDTTNGGGIAMGFASGDGVRIATNGAQTALFNATAWTWGPTASAAATGTIRVPTAFSFRVKDSGGTDRVVLSEASTEVFFGTTTLGHSVYWGGSALYTYASAQAQTILTNGVIYYPLGVGGASPVATTGTFRHGKNQSVLTRNDDNTANLTIWAMTATNVMSAFSDFTTLSLGASVTGTLTLGSAPTTLNISNTATTINIGSSATTVNVANTATTTASFGTGATTTNIGKASATVYVGDAAISVGSIRVQASNIDLFVGGFSQAQFTASGMAIGFNAAAPSWIQNVDATAATTGKTWTIRAQDASGTGASTGGNLKLSAGNGTANNAAGGHAWILGGSKTGTGTVGNICLGQALPASWQAGEEIIFLGDMTTAPTGNPASGGFMYSSAGALIWRGSSGTVTTIAPA